MSEGGEPRRPDAFALKGVEEGELEEGEELEEEGELPSDPPQQQEQQEHEGEAPGEPALLKPGFVERMSRLATTASPPPPPVIDDPQPAAPVVAAPVAAAAPPPSVPPPPPPPVAPAQPAKQENGTRLAASLSSFARRLLAAPREKKEVEVPEAIPLNDFILEGFGKAYRRRPTADEGEADSEEEEGEGNGGSGRPRRPGEGDGDGSSEDGDEEGEGGEGEEDAKAAGGKDSGGGGFKAVRAWNLWFQSTEATLRAAFGQYGELERLEMLKDRDTQKFRGVVIATYKKPQEAAQALERLHGSVIDNRTVFLEPSDRGNRRGSAGGGRNESRYFLLDKTLFCRRCHGVGHTAKFCPNPAKSKPCTVCAATDGHEANGCPELVAGPVGTLCLVCGGADHDDGMGCDRRDRAAGDLKGNANIRCLRCAELGHGAICGLQANEGRVQPPRFVYCHRCGGTGHFGPDCDVYPPTDASGRRRPSLRRHSYHGKHIRFDRDRDRDRRSREPSPPPQHAAPPGYSMPPPPPPQYTGGYGVAPPPPPPPSQYDPPPPQGGGYYPPSPHSAGGYYSPPRRGGESRGRDWEDEGDYGRDRQRRRSDRY